MGLFEAMNGQRFTDTKSLNEWMRIYKYEWLPGEERLIKAQMTEYDALATINDLKMEGAVRKRG